MTIAVEEREEPVEVDQRGLIDKVSHAESIQLPESSTY